MEGGVTDTVLCDELQKVFDTSKYTLGQVQFSEDLHIIYGTSPVYPASKG